MGLVVQKFGGTSVANAQRVMAAARRAIRTKQAGHQVLVVVSARGDTTDELIELAKEICEQPPAREMDMLLSTGEQISIALLAMAIQTLGEKAISFTGGQIVTEFLTSLGYLPGAHEPLCPVYARVLGKGPRTDRARTVLCSGDLPWRCRNLRRHPHR